MNPNPGSAVLADLLAVASDEDRLVETDQLLRGLVGADVVNAAHTEWTDRMREGLVAQTPAPSDATPADVFDLTARLRAGTSRHLR